MLDLDAPSLSIALVTLGDPKRLTGGYLYHLRLAELAPRHGARIGFVSFPDWPFPLARLASRRIARDVRALQPDAVLLDSIAAAFYGRRSKAGADRPAPPLRDPPPAPWGYRPPPLARLPPGSARPRGL